MGVKGLKKVLKSELIPFMTDLDKNNEIVCIDVLGLIFAYCYSCIEEVRTPDDSDTNEVIRKRAFLVNDSFRMSLDSVTNLMAKTVGNICLKCAKIKLCVDGDKRPFLKQEELRQRHKKTRANPKANFLKMAIQNFKMDFVKMIAEKLKNMKHDVEVIKSEYEADCIVSSGTIIITTDTDIIMFAVFNDQVKYVGFSERGGVIRYVHIPTLKSKYNINQLIMYTFLAGNDYLPSIYSPQDPMKLFGKVTNNLCDSYGNIYKFLRKCNKPLKSKEEVEPIVINWIDALSMYYMYLRTSNPLFIDKPTRFELKTIKDCDPCIVYECLKNKKFDF